jgi:hypothetical protein
VLIIYIYFIIKYTCIYISKKFSWHDYYYHTQHTHLCTVLQETKKDKQHHHQQTNKQPFIHIPCKLLIITTSYIVINPLPKIPNFLHKDDINQKNDV